jgi:capsule polysaccharide export protein KpsE/RkpR
MMSAVVRDLYRRAFVERIQAVTTRTDTLIGEVGGLRKEIAQLGFKLDETSSQVQELSSEIRGVKARQEALERHVETVIAGGWDATALARRLATLEDRIESR